MEEDEGVSSSPPAVPDQVEPLAVVRLGHPILRDVAEPVPESWFASAPLHDFGLRLVRTMLEAQGVGLAAPQVAEGLRMFSYWLPADDDQPGIEPIVLVNPEVKIVDSALDEGWEGCLSIPGLRGLVPRYRRIKVKARSVDGTTVSLTADGFQARVIQHEHDHLDGIVFLDRMASTRSLTFEEEWERYLSHLDDFSQGTSADPRIR